MILNIISKLSLMLGICVTGVNNWWTYGGKHRILLLVCMFVFIDWFRLRVWGAIRKYMEKQDDEYFKKHWGEK